MKIFDNIYASSFITIGGTSSAFIKADGTLDSSIYLTLSSTAFTLNQILSSNNNANSLSIINLSDGINPQDAATFHQIQDAINNIPAQNLTLQQVLTNGNVMQVGQQINSSDYNTQFDLYNGGFGTSKGFRAISINGVNNGVLAITPESNLIQHTILIDLNAPSVKKNGNEIETQSNKGIPYGYAPLNASAVIDSAYLPSYVDDVLEYAGLVGFPLTGESGKIYIALDTNLEYRWSGSVYVNIAKGDVQSVNTKTGAVTLNQDEIPDGATYKQYSATEKTKLASIASGANIGVVPNTAITGATKTKITYDAKGLVTSGTDATTSDIADSINKRYVTDTNLVVIGNTSNINTGDNATNTQYSGLTTSKENAITATTSVDFWSGAKTFINFATTVNSTILTGLSNATSQAIAATDSVVLALGYLQGQINANISSISLKSNIASPTFTGTVTTPALSVSGQTASTVPYLDASKNLVSSSVTPTQLGFLDATSSIQAQINAKGVGTIKGTLPATAGLIPFSTGVADTVATDSNLFWDNTNKRVGIKTSSPSGDLSIAEKVIFKSAPTTGSDGFMFIPATSILPTTASPASQWVGFNNQTSIPSGSNTGANYVANRNDLNDNGTGNQNSLVAILSFCRGISTATSLKYRLNSVGVSNSSVGMYGSSVGASTTGVNFGLNGSAVSSLTANVGVIGRGCNSSGVGDVIGVFGYARTTGTGKQIAGYFTLADADPTYVSAVIVAETGLESTPMFIGRQNGTQVFYIANNGNLGIGTNITPTAFVSIAPSTTSIPQLNLPNGVTPTTPIQGDIWSIGNRLLHRTNGVTETIAYVSSTIGGTLPATVGLIPFATGVANTVTTTSDFTYTDSIKRLNLNTSINGDSYFTNYNTSTGTSARAIMFVGNGVGGTLLAYYGTNYTTSGLQAAGVGALYYNGSARLLIGAGGTSDISFATNGASGAFASNTEVLRLNQAGNAMFANKVYVGNISTTPTAKIHVAAGTTSANTAPLKLTAGTNMTTPENGAIEFDGAEYFVSANSARQNINKGLNGSYTSTVTAVTIFTVTFGGTQPNTTYKVNITPTNALSSALFYVTNKTATTFDVTYLSALTGAVAYDWILTQ